MQINLYDLYLYHFLPYIILPLSIYIISYLNINSLGNKIDQLRDICKKASVDILCIDETKIDSSFPDSQFYIEGYQFPPSVEIEI